MKDLEISICAVLLAEACNIGIEPLLRNDIPALTKDRLSWVKQNYIRSETIIKANARLVDTQATLPLAHRWGGGAESRLDCPKLGRFIESSRLSKIGNGKCI